MTVNIHEAKTNLSKLIVLLERGEDIVIAKAGNPVAKLVSYFPSKKRVPNSLRGKIVLQKGFDDTDDEILALFEDGE